MQVRGLRSSTSDPHPTLAIRLSSRALKGGHSWEGSWVWEPVAVLPMTCTPMRPTEVQCVHETQQQLRKLVHEIGLELKTTAVCSRVRRTRDGLFTLDDALLRTQWDLQNIQEAIQAAAPRVVAELEKNLRPHSGTQQLPGPAGPQGSGHPDSALGLGCWRAGRAAGGAVGGLR